MFAVLLGALYRRYLAGARAAPHSPEALGLTMTELEELTGLPSVQRRLSELRLCGLVVSSRGGQELMRATSHGGPERVNFVTAAGVTALRSIAPQVIAQGHHPSGRGVDGDAAAAEGPSFAERQVEQGAPASRRLRIV